MNFSRAWALLWLTEKTERAALPDFIGCGGRAPLEPEKMVTEAWTLAVPVKSSVVSLVR